MDPSSLYKCHKCGNSLFKIHIDDEYGLLLYECSGCGYINTFWSEVK